jgi:serine/threonine protein phosphatase PrpC
MKHSDMGGSLVVCEGWGPDARKVRRVSDGIARAALYGADHEELGRVASLPAGPRTALALTRGLHPKTYRYEDPNEDVVAAVAGPASTLLVCADGHSGKLASHVAVRALLELVGDPPEALRDKAWLELFGAVNDAILAEKGVVSPQAASETVLVAALVSGDRVSFAAIGDAALVLVRPGAERGRQLNKESMRFLGRPLSGRALKGAVHRGETAVGAGEWVVAVTDGLSEFIAPLRPADVLPRVLAGTGDAPPPEVVARAVADAAGAAGAGDNVGVVTLGPA